MAKGRGLESRRCVSVGWLALQKVSEYSDDPRVRPQLAWCYAQMGMLESAAQHYRQAYARNKHPDVALGLAQLESDLGNIEAARALVQALAPSRHELSVGGVALLDSLGRHLEAAQEGRR